jgi:hypothetical protein
MTTQRLVGYDRTSELVVEEFLVSADLLPRVRQIAHVPDDDPEVTQCYRLSSAEAREIAWTIEARIDPDKRDYFLEGFA